MKYLLSILSLALLTIASPDASAVKIRNFDDVPHDVVLRLIGGEQQSVSIPPDQYHYAADPRLDILFEGSKTKHAKKGEEYVIKNGVLYLQIREIYEN